MIHLSRRHYSTSLVSRLTARSLELSFRRDAIAPPWGCNSHTENWRCNKSAKTPGESTAEAAKFGRKRRKKAEFMFEKMITRVPAAAARRRLSRS